MFLIVLKICFFASFFIVSLIFSMMQMRQGCMEWSFKWSGWCVGWDLLIACGVMFFETGWVLLWRLKIWQFIAIWGVAVWSCHSSQHQLPNIWGYGAWNNWEKDERSIKKTNGRLRKGSIKETSLIIWLDKRRCIRSREMATAN